MSPLSNNLKTRIAPTPSGLLHRGNLLNFLMIHEIAQRHKIQVLLRIDDLDQLRMREEYVDDIFHTLKQLGIAWHEGPKNALELKQHWSQTLRQQQYRAWLERLRQRGAIYACRCTRREIGDRPYTGTCRKLALDLKQYPWRADLSRASDFKLGPALIEIESLEDPVVWRREGLPAYHVANIVDDEAFAITHIVRGEDLRDSTLVQLALTQLLGPSRFQEIRFAHHALIRDGNGHKLSKSQLQHSDGALLTRFEQLDELVETARTMAASLEFLPVEKV